MIAGMGIDLTELERVENILLRHGSRFLRLTLTPAERDALPKGLARQTAYVAARFAAKEAAVKALGTGFCMGITLQHIEITNDLTGKPSLHFLGAAAERAQALGVRTAHLSLTHSRRDAAAVVVLEK